MTVDQTYHPEVLALLELAEAKTPLKDVPARLDLALKVVKGDLIVVEPPHPLGWTDAKTIQKEAHELKKGDFIRLLPDDKQGYRVDYVEPGYHTVDVCGSGAPLRWGYNAIVTVFDGPLPEQRFTPERLLLTDKGESVRAMNLLSTTTVAPSKPRKKEKTVDERIMSMLREDPLRIDWPASKWAKILDCSPAAVKLTKAWQETINKARTLNRAARMSDD